MDRARVFDDLKFMWDGGEYGTQEEAFAKRTEYEQDGFSVQQLQAEGKHFLFTRRVVKEVVTSAA